MTDADIQIARLDERFANMKEEFQKLETKVDEIDVKLDQVLEALHGAQGGWKTMMLIGSVVAAVATGIAWAISHVSIK